MRCDDDGGPSIVERCLDVRGTCVRQRVHVVIIWASAIILLAVSKIWATINVIVKKEECAMLVLILLTNEKVIM